MTSSATLLDTLSSELINFDQTGSENLNDLVQDSNNFLSELKAIESELIKEANEETTTNTESSKQKNSQVSIDKLSKLTDKWYKSSISRLKAYNSANNKFSKNVLNNSKFNIDLDDAYTYPLLLNSYPDKGFVKEPPPIKNGNSNYTTDESRISYELQSKRLKSENKEELVKAIALHLLKNGECELVPEILKELSSSSSLLIDRELFEKFTFLNQIVDNIVNKHDLTMALNWFNEKYNDLTTNNVKGSVLGSGATTTNSSTINLSVHVDETDSMRDLEFKFHMLQFTILLNGNDSSFSLDDALAAYLYSKDNFSKFFKDYINEISPLMTLLLFKTNKDNDTYDDFYKKNMLSAVKNFINKMKQGYYLENEHRRNNNVHAREVKFVGELLSSFENIHTNKNLFLNLGNEFISEYCKDMKLSDDSSLFQSILAGHIYLSSFYKYNQIQVKLKKLKSISGDENQAPANTPTNDEVVNFVATYHFELPFQLPDSNRFLFKYHPIFICPVSREQLIPITENASKTQAVVLNYCQHLALRDSIWHLSKKGMEIFKCHYCYKKHKYNDITDAYFIDL
ncbi:RMD5 E3 ubiquitin-protein ligase RMD5 [Candida maltosa Xu316]